MAAGTPPRRKSLLEEDKDKSAKRRAMKTSSKSRKTDAKAVAAKPDGKVKKTVTKQAQKERQTDRHSSKRQGAEWNADRLVERYFGNLTADELDTITINDETARERIVRERDNLPDNAERFPTKIVNTIKAEYMTAARGITFTQLKPELALDPLILILILILILSNININISY